MSYKYDIFISYKREDETLIWFKGFKDWMVRWLSNELAWEPRAFLDTEDISTGDRWRQKIAGALNESRCMVCIWSPPYFRSKWCVAEWQTFNARAQEYNREIIVPARYHDGEYFPESAQAIQSRDFSKYTSLSPVFWKTELAMQFEQEHLKDYASEIAAAIHRAPEHTGNFPVIEEPDTDYMIGETIIGRPGR